MKKYKLKEEVKKYLNNNIWGSTNALDEAEFSLSDWAKDGLTIEALEEVEERIEVCIDKTEGFQQALYFESGENPTEQQREDIEKFLNVFGSWGFFKELYDKYDFDVANCDYTRRFYVWLKEKGYDKQ